MLVCSFVLHCHEALQRQRIGEASNEGQSTDRWWRAGRIAAMLFATAQVLAGQVMTPRIAVGGILHESNTFSSDPTDLDDFLGRSLRRGREIHEEYATSQHEIGGYIEAADRLGFDLVYTVVANATPAGPVTDAAFDSLTAELIERLQQSAPVDGLLLALHGAMVVESHPDGDAEVLRRLRGALGDELTDSRHARRARKRSTGGG